MGFNISTFLKTYFKTTDYLYYLLESFPNNKFHANTHDILNFFQILRKLPGQQSSPLSINFFKPHY